MASKHSLGFAERILPRVLVSLVLARMKTEQTGNHAVSLAQGGN
ncbi:hypothetical protein ACXA45_11845 [Neomicrococcus lactis]